MSPGLKMLNEAPTTDLCNKKGPTKNINGAWWVDWTNRQMPEDSSRSCDADTSPEEIIFGKQLNQGLRGLFDAVG